MKSYVANHRPDWNARQIRGTISREEAVQEVRAKVEGAAPFQDDIRVELASLCLPDQRKAGHVTPP